MKAVTVRTALLLVLCLASCSTPRSASPSPSLSPSASALPTTSVPTPTPTSSPSTSPIPLPTIAQLSAPTGTVLWALVGGTRLFRSTDRGDTWTERTIPTGVANLEIAFADDTNGLILTTGSPAAQCQAQTASIWRTTNGAASWQQGTATGIADAMCKTGLTASDATHALLAASSPGNAPVIYRSTDAGITWQASAPLSTPPNLASQGSTFVTITGRPRAFGPVVLIDGGGGQQTKDVFRSTDGGATWTYASTAPTFQPIAYATATRWLQIGPPDQSKETTDGGLTWHSYATDYSQAAPIAPDVVFGDAMFGYATVRGSIQRTTDGGAHWTAIKTPGT